MDVVPVNIPCPVCKVEGHLGMMTHVDEIPYFGEHTQVTVLCDSCGWRQTDFIPAEGKKPGASTLVITRPDHISARVIRSSSCTVRLLELDLEVNSSYLKQIQRSLTNSNNLDNIAFPLTDSKNSKLYKLRVLDGEIFILSEGDFDALYTSYI